MPTEDKNCVDCARRGKKTTKEERSETRKKNQTNEIYFSHFNSTIVSSWWLWWWWFFLCYCLRFCVDDFFFFSSFIDFHMLRSQAKLKVPMQKFGIYTLFPCMLSEYDVNNPTYLLNLCTFVTG